MPTRPARAIDRRTLLTGAWRVAAGAALARLAPWGDLAASAQAPVAKERLLVRSVRPEDFETPVALLNSWITPNDLFYVRSHFYTPTIDPARWTLTVGGTVARPLTLTLDDLRRMPAVSSVVTLECAGNGRALFDPAVAGVQWQKGAVGTARWTGVRLADVLARAGARDGTRFVWMNGADVPLGTAPDFVRQLPIAKALHPDTLLAYEMNGVPLPAQHGFPLRMIVPGWEGAYSVKWLTGLEASEREHDGFWVQTAYRYPKAPVAPGSLVAASDTVPVAGLALKSIITAPAERAQVRPGLLRIGGFAWSGDAEIASVDVSVDDGATWVAASLGSDRAPFAWRQFTYEWTAAAPGSYVLRSRATDARGRVQPMTAQWNPSGYLFNAVDRVPVQVGESRGATLVRTRCVGCHQTDLIEQQRLDRAGWTREVEKMMRWGAGMDDADKAALVEYLVERHGVGR